MAKMEFLKRKEPRASEAASAQVPLNEIPVEGHHEEEVKMGGKKNRKGNVRRQTRSSVQRSSLECSTRACRPPSTSSSSSDSSSLSPSSQSLPLLSRNTRRYSFFSGSFRRRRLQQLTAGLLSQRLARGSGRNGGKSAASVETPGPRARCPSSARQGSGAPSAMVRGAMPFLRVQRSECEMPANTGAEQASKPPKEPNAELSTSSRDAEAKVKDAGRGEENEVAKKACAKGRKPPAERREAEASRREGESAGDQPAKKSEDLAAVGERRDEATQHEGKKEKRRNRRDVIQCHLRHVELLKQRQSEAKDLESCEKPGVSLRPLHMPAADSTPRCESAGAEREGKNGDNGDNGDSVHTEGLDLEEEVDATPDKERNGEKNAGLTLPPTARHCRAPEPAAYTARIGDLETLLSRQGASHSRLALRCLDTASVYRAFEKGEGEAQTSSRGAHTRAEATVKSPAAIGEERHKLFSRYRAELRRFWVAREQDVFRFLRQCCTVQGLDRLAQSSSSSPSSPSCCASAVSPGVSACDGAAFNATHSPAERVFLSEAPGRSSDADETGRGRASVEGQCQWSGSPELGGDGTSERARVDVCGDGGDASLEEDAQVEAVTAEREDDGRCLRKPGTGGAPQPAPAGSLTNRRRIAFYRDLIQTNLHVAAQAADVSETATCAAALLRQVPVRMRSWRREVHMRASGCDPDRAGHTPSRLGSDGCAQKRYERQGEAAGTATSEDTTAGRRGDTKKARHGKNVEGAFEGPSSRLKLPRGRGSVAESGCAGESLGDGEGLRWKEENEQEDEKDLSADESRRRLALLEAACCRLFLVCVRGATKPLVSSHPSFSGSPASGTNTAILECLSVVLQLLEHFGDPGDAPNVQAKNGGTSRMRNQQVVRLSRVGEPKSWCAWLLRYSAEGKEKNDGDWRNLRERPRLLFFVVKVVKEICRELRLGNWARVLKVYVHLKNLAVAWLVCGNGPRSGSDCMRVSSACKLCVATNAGKENRDEETVEHQGNTRYWSAVPAEVCSGAIAELLLTTFFLLEVFVSDLRVAAAEVVFKAASRQSGLEEKELRLKELLRHFPVGPAGAAMAVETSRHANAYPEKDHGKARNGARIQRNGITSHFSSSFFSPLDEFASALPPSLQRLLQSDNWRKDAEADIEAAVRAALEEGFAEPSSETKTPRKASNAGALLRQLKSLEDLDLRTISKKKSNQRA
ncbi:hypothetical protein TGRUB_289110 [Toxoplasma gondii RUB]|uniref:Uncharacterized protein n=1 Tax=Toxoplasma gondii RUB TaxID=935652 RepID=A0A086M156_TOXGO|nr:hypothetical protein TGRUB_289110 [Toxoplasma gondii RUB]